MQLQEFDYTVMVEESTRAALASILTHQFKEKKEKKEPKNSPPPAPPPNKEIEQASALYFDGANKMKEGKAAAKGVLFLLLCLEADPVDISSSAYDSPG